MFYQEGNVIFKAPNLSTISDKFYFLTFNNFGTPCLKLDVIKERSQIKLTCGAAKSKVAMSFIKIFHDLFATSIEAVPEMKKVKDIVKKAKANITNGKIFAW